MGLPYVLHPVFPACASRRNHSNNVFPLHVTYLRRSLTSSLCSMYRDSDEATLEDNVIKVERTAALRRSTIRREHSAQPRRHIPPTGRARRELAEIIGEVQRPHRSPFVDANDEIQHLEAELEQFRHRILTTARPGPRESRNPPSMTRVNPQDVILRSAAAADIVDQLPRESSLRFNFAPRAPARSGATSPRHYRTSRDSWTNHRTLPSPPNSIESTGRVRAPRGGRAIVLDGPIYAEDGYTVDFAPARGPHSGTPQPSEGMNRVILERN